MRFSLTMASTLVLSVLSTTAQDGPGNGPANRPAAPFPSADFVLRDAPHKEPRSGVQLQGGQLTIASGVGTPTTINALSFSADGKILVAGKDFGRVVIWDVEKKKFLRAIDTDQGMVRAVAVSPDGRSIATGGSQDNNSVKIWDVSTGNMLWKFAEARAEIGHLFFDMQGKWLAISDNTSNLYILDMAEHRSIVTLPDIHAVAMARDGESLISTDGKEFAVWTAPSWKKTQSLPMPNKFSLLLAANSATDQLAIYERRVVKVEQLNTGKTILERADLVSKNFTWRPEFAAFSSDGSLLYLSIDGRLLILDVKSGDTCSGPVMYSGAAGLSPDGQWFAGAKDDSIVSRERTDGVWVWSTNRLLEKCSVGRPSRTAP